MSIVNTLPFRNLMIVHGALGGTASTTIFNAESPHCRVLDAWCIMNAAGATSDTVAVDDGTTDITDKIDVSAAADKAIVRAGTIDDAKAVLVKDSTLRVTHVSAAPADTFVLIMLLGD